MIFSNTELMLIINRWAVAKYLTTNSTAKILPSVNSETKRPMQTTIYTWITKCKRKCIRVLILCWNAFSVLNIWLLAQQCKVRFPPKPRWIDCKHCNAQLLPDCEYPFQSRVRYFSCRALQSYYSPGDWARETFKHSKDSTSLVVKIEKKIFRFGFELFWGERHM